MNTTFTNYAEKKAKHFFNLLQGYTRGIRITAILILLLMGVSNAWGVNITSGTKLYLKPNANWNQDGARFAAYFFGNGEAWVSMTKIAACDGDIYEVTSPSKNYPNVIFCRMNPSTTANNWNNKWNQTSDLTYDGTNNLYTVKEGTWNQGGGTWSIAEIKTTMTYTVTVPEGTEKCYIIGEWDGWKEFKEMASGAGNTFSISFESCSGYGYKYACAPSWGFQELNGNCNGTINDRTYSASDVVECWSKKTIYVKVDHSDWKKNNERFAIYWWDNDSHNGWVDLEEIACNNYYKADIPLYETSFSIVRMNGATSANNWDNKWNQTIDLNWTAAGDNNLYTVNGKESEKYKGFWSSSLLKITTNTTTGGNITVLPGETVNIGETITVTLNAQPDFVKGNATIKIGNNSAETLVEGQAYTICGATTIDAEFIPSTPTPVYLKTTNWNADNAWFAIYWWKSAGNDGWVKMNPVDCNGDYYYGEVPAGTTHFIFVRLKPSTENGYNSSNNGLHWDNKWNQTGNLGLPNADANLFTPNATEGATATWSAYVAPTYSITINAGTGGNVSVSKSSNIALNEEVTVTISTSEGYTYKSGTIAIGTNETTNIIEGSSKHTICGPTTITAQWTANKYTVTLDNQGATTAGTASVQATYDSPMPAATMPKRTGYTFGGYYTAADGSGTQYYKADGTSDKKWDIASETTLYAKWTANTYTITWNANGGTVDPTSSTYIYDGDQVVLPTPKREGYTFNGWFTDSSGGERINDVGKENKPTSNITYYAHWAENLFPVTISASANGSVTPSGEQQIGIVERSVSATANTGYQFKNWTVTGGAKVADANSASTTVTATATGTVTANFTAITYTITYNLNNGTGTMNPTSYTVETETFNLPTPTRAGYTFAGWFENSNLTGVAVTQITKGSTGNKKFYAKWTEILSTITIEINPVEGGIVKVDGQEVTSGQTVEVGVETSKQITLQANTGYGIAAFKQEGAAIIAGTGTYTLKADGSGNPGKLIANFTKNSYTFTLVQAEGGNATATVNGKAISSPATLEHGTQITLNATAADKYKFSKWVNGNGAQVSTDNPYTHTLTANTTIQAVFTNTDILYLKLNNYWKNDVNNGVWFAAYFYKNGSDDNYWVKMKNENPCGGSDYYKVQIPDGNWTNVIFCRMNKECHDLKWDCRWDQTQNLTIPTDGKNLFTINTNEQGGDGNNNSGAKGSWSTHTPENYEPVVFNVTVPPRTPNCYIIGDWDGWSQFTEMTKVDDTHYTITIPDVCATSAKYKYCYGPSWGCQEVKSTSIPTEGISDRTYNSSDNVAAWISYYIVGYNNNWDYNNGYKFDINGNLNVHLATVTEHYFKIKSSMGEVYTTDSQDGGKHKFNRSHTSEYIPQTDASWHNLELNVDVAGYYDFTFNPVNKLLTIVFPSKGYRLKITMTDGSGKVYTSNEVNNETETLSFFAPGSDDSKLSADITLEYQGNQRATIPSTSFKTSGVYTAKLNSNKNGITEPVLYNGNYYIRTDGAHGGWNSHKTNSDNKMTYFVPREEEKYSYYWVEALPRAARDHTNGIVNVKACVANEYNENLAVMLEADKFTDGYGNVEIKDPSDQNREKINVRFGYNPKTNFFERAMLTGSGNTNTFLNITAPDYVYLDNDQKVKLTTADKNSKFTDVSNWVYQKDIWVKPPTTEGASVYLTAEAYNEEVNSLFGFDENGAPIARKIIGTNSGELRKMRTIYDFKTNRMIIAWAPDAQNITTGQSLEADVLFIRHENEVVPQLTFTPEEGQIKGIQSQFFALELENARDKNAEEHYWISLPFDCVVGSISGVPGYMEIWGIQRYNGEERAQKGWFKETSTFWEWLEPDDVMNAGEGYVLSFDKKAATWNDFDVHDDDGNLTGTESLLRLYFPSTTKGFEFKNSQPEREYVNQPCTITRDNRHLQDGNWKIIGPMSYNNVMATPTKYGAGNDVWKPDQDGDHVDVPEGEYKWSAPMFRYKYWEDESGNDWKYIPEDGTTNTYNSFFGYMVQFAGLIQWNSVSVSEPVLAGLTARRNTDTNERTNITMRLEIVNAEGKQQDQTFVALDVEATTTFDQNKDLNKIFNDGETNIYSLSEGIPFAGNALPMEESVVPVGVQIAAEGEYTFRMPDGTEGMVVELVDYETNTRTNLLLSDYTITLSAGSYENRFALNIQPQKDVVTGVGNVGDETKGIEKYLIDGKLIIRTAEGAVYDAQGKRM